MSASVHAGPSAPALSSTWARRTLVDDPDKVSTTCPRAARSVSVGRTMYFFCMVGPSG